MESGSGWARGWGFRVRKGRRWGGAALRTLPISQAKAASGDQFYTDTSHALQLQRAGLTRKIKSSVSPEGGKN